MQSPERLRPSARKRHTTAVWSSARRQGVAHVMFGIEVLVRLKCSGFRRLLAAIHDPASIARVLLAMALSSAVPEQAGCRSPQAGGGVVYIDEGPAE